MNPLLQDGIVTLVALGSGAVLLRRLVGFVKPDSTDSGCAHCAVPKQAAATACGARTGESTRDGSIVMPLRVMRKTGDQ
jgi:hypothetical protein